MPVRRAFVLAPTLISLATSAMPMLAAEVTFPAAAQTVAASQETMVGDVATALMPSGRHVVVWRDTTPGDSHRLYFRIMDQAGAVTAQLAVTPELIELDPHPAVAINDAGSFLIAWRGNDALWCRLYDGLGRPLGPPREVEPPAVGWHANNPLVLGFGGQFLVLWNRLSATPEAWARWFGPDGQPTGEPAVASTWGRVCAGSISTNAWFGILSPDGTVPTLWATRVLDGIPSGEYAVVAMPPGGFVGEGCAIAALRDGGALIFWSQVPDDGHGTEVLVRGLDDAGMVTGTAERVSTGSEASNPAATPIAGGVLVAWEELDAGDVVARAYAEDGTALGPTVVAAAGDASEHHVKPRLYVLGVEGEDGVLAWEGASVGGVPSAVHSRQLTTACSAGNRLCLGQESRFRLTVSWRTEAGRTGSGTVHPLTEDTGAIWFFDDGNLELMVKILDACTLNQHFWVFVAGLTDVYVELTVTDSETGVIRTYANPQKHAFSPIQDTSAFATCP
jgi:hypothetical protein